MSDITPHRTIDDRISSKRYPYRFSAGIVDQFITKYSRVTYFVAKKLGYNTHAFREKLIEMFMWHNTMWNAFREALKYIDKHDMYAYLSGYERADFIYYLKGVKSLMIDELLDNGKIHKLG